MDAQHPWMARARFLGAPDRLARLVSSSLYRAQWSEAVALRQAFQLHDCLLYTSPSPRDRQKSRMPSSA